MAAFDPYHKWLGISPKDQPPDHYRLLAIDRFESDPDVIESAADQRMAHVHSLQTGKYSDLSQKLLNEIAGARVCLLQPDMKEEYDRQLRQHASPPVAATSTGGKIPELRVSPPAAIPGTATHFSQANTPPLINSNNDLPQLDLHSH